MSSSFVSSFWIQFSVFCAQISRMPFWKTWLSSH
jgi:hypothetical protein